MVTMGKSKSALTWRKFAYVFAAAIVALILLSWMHNPRTPPPTAPIEEVPQLAPSDEQNEPYVESEKEGTHPYILPEEQPDTYSSSSSSSLQDEATTSVASSTSIEYIFQTMSSAHIPSPTSSSTQTPSPTSSAAGKSTLPMFNGEIVDGLTAEQCDEAFPNLYLEIDRRLDYWKKRGHKITQEDIDIAFRAKHGEEGEEKGGGAMRVLIHENEVRIVESRWAIGHMGYRGRVMGSLELIERAMRSATYGGEMLPTIEFSMIVQDDSETPDDDDTGTISFWTYAQNIYRKSQMRVWLMPNFDLWYAWPQGSFEDARRRGKQYDAPFTKKIQKMVWRGGGWNNWNLRKPLVDLAEGKDWANIEIADWGGRDASNGMALEEFCKYAMTVHTEGVTYSGRMKYLQNCNSLMFVHDLEWSTYYTHLLQPSGPNQNYVNVRRDWADLEEKVKYYFDHPDEAEKIIANALDTFRNKYITRAATSCYIRKLIKAYASVSFEPKINGTVPEGKDVDNLRGRSFQRFMDGPQDFIEDDYVDV